MDKVNKIEDRHLITDLKSLEDESLTLLGLDIDEALENSKKYGVKIKKRAVLIQSIVAMIILLIVIGASTYLTFQARNAANDTVQTVNKVEVKETPAKEIIATDTDTETDTDPVNAPSAIVIEEPFVFPAFEAGNAELCNIPSPTPDSNGVTIGTAFYIEKFDTTTDGDTFPIENTPGIVNVKDARADNGQYVKFADGSFTGESYRKQSPTGLVYCDANNKIDVNYTSTGYTISHETH